MLVVSVLWVSGGVSGGLRGVLNFDFFTVSARVGGVGARAHKLPSAASEHPRYPAKSMI